MKKGTWSGVTAALCIVLCAAVLAACSTKDALVGTWQLETVEYGDEIYDVAQFAEQLGLEPADMQGTYQFNSDGTVVATLAGNEYPWTYEVDGDTVTLTPDSPAMGDDTVTLTYDAAGGTLTAQIASGATGVFKKQSD